MKCGCKNGKLEEIAKTKVSDAGIVKQTSYAICTGCETLYNKYQLENNVKTEYFRYGGPLTAEGIKKYAPSCAGVIGPCDLARIIQGRYDRGVN